MIAKGGWCAGRELSCRCDECFRCTIAVQNAKHGSHIVGRNFVGWCVAFDLINNADIPDELRLEVAITSRP